MSNDEYWRSRVRYKSKHGLPDIKLALMASLMLALIIASTLLIKVSSSHAFVNGTESNVTKKICSGVHIRNDLKSFEQLRGCTIIDGPLTIALVSNQSHPYEPKDFENISFPELREITEYLLFFRVQGLTHLSTLFPNLAVIRGRELVANYALIIYEMMHLQKVALPKLNDILRGSVRIESNPNLCYVSTINWEAISKHGFVPHFIRDNNARCNNNRCPDNCRPWSATSSRQITTSSNANDLASNFVGDIKEFGSDTNRSLFCWSNQICQETCPNPEGKILSLAPNGRCCSPQCAGGCYAEDRPDRCITCRHVSQGNECVEHCINNLFEFKGECITAQDCERMAMASLQDDCSKSVQISTNFKAIRLPGDIHGGHCQVECPPGFEEDSTNKHICKPCDKGKCRKVCTPPDSGKPFMVTNVNSLRELSGCNVINGSLEMSMKGGKNVLNELELVFQELEEIHGYLKITRSYPITTLGFFRSLKFIYGSELDRGHYSLTLIGNPNLQELFMLNSSDSNRRLLTISEGTIFAHLNHKLCPDKIEALKNYASVKDWDERDVSIHTNGDKEACNTDELFVEFQHSSARLARITFENYASKMDDPRSLLYYLINYRELANGTTTMFDGKDGCNSQNDVWQTIEESPIKSSLNHTEKFQTAIIPVKPATRYALYIKTYTILGGSKGALSGMLYFETAPDTPSWPRQIASSASNSSSIKVYWLPPSKPNGEIEYYMLNITKVVEMDDLQNIDVCNSIESRDRITEKFTGTEPKQSSLLPSDIDDNKNHSSTECASNCCSEDGSKSDSDAKASLQVEKVTFQDIVIDIVYLRQPCQATHGSANKIVKKRSIDYDVGNQESIVSQNSLPRKQHATNSVQIGSRLDSQPPGNLNLTPKETGQQYNIPVIEFISSQNTTGKKILVSDLKPGFGQASLVTAEVDITHLEHFTVYAIEIVACQREFVGRGAKISPSYNKCGLQAITQVRTQALPENDRILKNTIAFYPANETLQDNLMIWEKPERPNGLVLAYRIRYRLKSSERWTEVCINNTAFNLQGLLPGIYLFGVRAITMYSGLPLWSEDMEFNIPQNYIISPTVLSILIVMILGILGLAVASGTYYYQKRKHELIYASVNPDYVQYEPDEWEVDKDKVIVGEKIGTGAFGQVFKGQFITEKGAIGCAIKTTPPITTTKQRMDFLREASIMKQFDTFHVVRLLGVVSVSTPVYVIMEYMEKGDLKEFLRREYEVHKKENKALIDGIYLMATQIADGMAYLASKKYVHRDLAARNCMVGVNRIVKIADFGLSRDVDENDYYRMHHTQVRLPVRWMSPEALSHKLFTTASDVWSYGIVLWEIITFGAYPYQGLSNDEVCKKIIGGYTMARPIDCTDKLWYIMDRCWRFKAKERPSFEEIIDTFLPETEEKLYPNCFYKKPKAYNAGDSIPEETNTGTESYPLLSWPVQRANGLTNGETHAIMSSGSPSSGDTVDNKDHLSS